jgi:ABC-type multidrug transport system fused ATPase/permease subunit
LDIDPGHLVLTVGENGSGKSTLLNILSGLVNPTEGEVMVDDIALSCYDMNTFRNATAFITQKEELYPVSVRDNMLMGLPNDSHRESITREDLTDAARLGGSLDLIEGKLRQGFETILKPCSIPSWSIQAFPGQVAFDAMNRDYPQPTPVEISPGEKQRLIV